MAKSRKDILNKIDELAFVRFYEEEKKYPVERLKKGYYFMCAVHHHEKIEDIVPHRLKAVFDKGLAKSGDKHKELMLIATYAKTRLYSNAATVYQVDENSQNEYAAMYKTSFENFCDELREKNHFHMSSVYNFYDASWIKHLTVRYIWKSDIKKVYEIVKRLEATQALIQGELLEAIIEETRAVRTMFFFSRNTIEPEDIDGTREPNKNDGAWSDDYIDMWYDEQENYLERDEAFLTKLFMGCNDMERFLQKEKSISIYKKNQEILQFAYAVKDAVKRISMSTKSKKWYQQYWNEEFAIEAMLELWQK